MSLLSMIGKQIPPTLLPLATMPTASERRFSNQWLWTLSCVATSRSFRQDQVCRKEESSSHLPRERTRGRRQDLPKSPERTYIVRTFAPRESERPTGSKAPNPRRSGSGSGLCRTRVPRPARGGRRDKAGSCRSTRSATRYERCIDAVCHGEKNEFMPGV
jgi:hypothetical protein